MSCTTSVWHEGSSGRARPARELEANTKSALTLISSRYKEYLALETTKTAANFDGIANAKMTKPRREQHDDAKIQEAPVFQGGGEDTGAGTGQVEGEDLRARQGLAKLGEHARLAHRFDPSDSDQDPCVRHSRADASVREGAQEDAIDGCR